MRRFGGSGFMGEGRGKLRWAWLDRLREVSATIRKGVDHVVEVFVVRMEDGSVEGGERRGGWRAGRVRRRTGNEFRQW
jgi:hypothetical protein